MAAEEECRKKSERLVALDKEMKNFKKQIAVSLLRFILFLGRKLTFTGKTWDFFLSGLSIMDTGNSQNSRWKEGEGAQPSFLPSTASTHSCTFTVLYMRCLPYISKFYFAINTSQRKLNKAWKITKFVKSKY